MDTGEGHLEMLQNTKEAIEKQKQHPKHGGIFRVGEIVELKGSRFKVKSINPK